MPTNRRKFVRPTGDRRYRKLFVISTEGLKTEPQYFALFRSMYTTIRVNCLRGKNGSSPLKVLQRMKKHLDSERLLITDEAWLVVDRDQWTDDDLDKLMQWSQTAANFGFALSNPKFEYWILLHFEEGTNISSSRECSDRLKRWLPDYDKGIKPRGFTIQMISSAVRRAKIRDNPPCPDWPRTGSGTTVYRLVEKLLDLPEPLPF